MRRLIAAASFAAAFGLLPVVMRAQTPAVDHLSVDHLTPADIIAKAQELEPKAQKGGSASVKLMDYPNHYTMVALRNKSGGAELHQNFADFFYIVRGKATLLTGGTIQDQTTSGPGEFKGSAVKGGTTTELNEGDVVHIPAGVSHQMLLPQGGELVYFVIKVKEQ
jgi:mannose-6-phosphate isomerase-like protein (cupin superfamily)